MELFPLQELDKKPKARDIRDHIDHGGSRVKGEQSFVAVVRSWRSLQNLLNAEGRTEGKGQNDMAEG